MEQIIEEYGIGVILFLVGISYVEALKILLQLF